MGSWGPNKGYVEISTPGYNWGGVCDDIYVDSMKVANVICRMAGYSKGALNYASNSAYGTGGDDFLLDDLRCTGNENDVFDCPANPIGEHNCGDGEWFGVECELDISNESELFPLFNLRATLFNVSIFNDLQYD